jgi:two-component system sensor histidine kinase CpxA
MRNLFLKIFLWFWATVVIVALTLVAVTVVTRSNESIRQDATTKIWLYLPLESRKAVAIYEHEGGAALKQHFDLMRDGGIVDPYLLDENDRDVLGRMPPAKAAQVVRAAREDAPSVSDFKGRNGFAAQRAVGRSGREYTTLLVITIPTVIDFIRELGIRTLFSLLAVLLVGSAFCFWLARHIARPVVRLSETAEQIADGGLNARCDHDIRSRRDEIGLLGRSFDRMAERIETLVKGQQRLLGDVSHELRSPLARLSVAEGLLRRCPTGEREELLDRVAGEVERLDQLIGQLLILARVDSGADSSHKERVDLSSLLQEVAVDGNFEAQASCRTVRVGSLETCMTLGAAEQLRRAIENVVRNAVRHTSPSTEVEVRLSRQAGKDYSRAIIHVRDHGPGVPREHLQMIFHPFYLVPRTNGGNHGGAGLGLAITDRIVRIHGGNVSAENAPDGGLIVRLELPLIA